MSKILVVGDTHHAMSNFNKVESFYPNLTRNDYVIVTGDFGFIWNTTAEGIREDDRWLEYINSRPWTTLFVDGNHENFSRLNNYPVEEWCGGKVHRIKKHIYHLMRGEVFTINGKTFFCFGGARSVDKAYRTAYKTWWPEEIPSQEEYDNAVANLKKINYSPNYIITHTMPDFFGHELYGGRYTDGDKVAHMLDDFLLQCVFDKWYCGHHHLDVKVRDNIQLCFRRVYEIE